MEPSGIVTLITDFGLSDPYVGQLKGALLSSWRAVQIVDICHQVQRHGLLEGAYCLATSYHHFPAGTVHLIVVDPGVGTDRAILAAQGDGHLFIAPDNGLLSILLAGHKIQSLHRVGHSQAGVSATFHGRDIMAPLAADLARGRSLKSLGEEYAPADCILLEAGRVEQGEGEVRGAVLRIDSFGNIRTSIRATDLTALRLDLPLEVELSGQRMVMLLSWTYGLLDGGRPGLLWDSDGFLEVAVNQGDAAALLGVEQGAAVVLRQVSIRQ
ncbi:SAM hydrolase/SAM-dependent halogenase family protein [Desulfogranum mediterraneum]|uniref:SAM hydrolase/SAM-dependent halogenase family protein n=1 Tax=Desulfogranum mediterraneum TaxID=160661 RepID=UPI00049160D3|nr:SAM-dependent chlorinase/fluorinase [Desulfogranum mediterraneum]